MWESAALICLPIHNLPRSLSLSISLEACLIGSSRIKQLWTSRHPVSAVIHQSGILCFFLPTSPFVLPPSSHFLSYQLLPPSRLRSPCTSPHSANWVRNRDNWGWVGSSVLLLLVLNLFLLQRCSLLPLLRPNRPLERYPAGSTFHCCMSASVSSHLCAPGFWWHATLCL